MKRLLLLAAVAASVGLGARPAHADIAGSCEATIDGVAVRGRSASEPDDAIRLDADRTVVVTATSSAGVDRYSIEMEFAGIQWEVASGAVSGSGWQREVRVADYAKYGVGLYRVRGISTGAGACEAEALVRITGRNPLSTFGGIIALIVTAGAAAGAATSARAAARLAGGAVQ